MSRSKLLDALGDYGRRYPEEGPTVDRFVTLVRDGQRSFERDHWRPGHVTSSAWVLNPAEDRVLLTHHKKLGIWVQLGGHCDGTTDVAGLGNSRSRGRVWVAGDAG